MSADLTGQRLGHYLLQSVLGRGGMSIVYRAVDERLDRPVALKVISENLSSDTEFRERFAEEARAASAIDHVNVVPLYDFGEAGDWLYIAMRLVDGTDLAREVSGGPLAQRRVLDLLGQVGEALDMLHERGLVHLDVKPANVLITRNESVGREHVYLADFGLTRRGTSGHRTASGDFLGSPTYASPEHLRGDPVLPTSDLYSLSCVLFSCLAGRPPFVGTVKEVVSGHLRGQVPSLAAFTGLPSAIDRVIARGMAADPALRYPTSAELLGSARRALTHYSDDEPPTGAVGSGAVGSQVRDSEAGGSAPVGSTTGDSRGAGTETTGEHSGESAQEQTLQGPGVGGRQPLLGRSINDEPPSGPTGPRSQSAGYGRAGSGQPDAAPPGGPAQPGSAQPGSGYQVAASAQFGTASGGRPAAGQQGGPPSRPPTGPPTGPPNGPPTGPPNRPPNGGSDGARHRAPGSRSPWPWAIAAAVLVIAIVVILVIALGGSGSAPTRPAGDPTGTSSSGVAPTSPTPGGASTVPGGPAGNGSAPVSAGDGPATGVLPTLINPSRITTITGLTIPSAGG